LKRFALFVWIAVLVSCTGKKPEASSQQAPPEYFKVNEATVAKIRGTVRFTGKKPPAKPISMDAEEACEKLHAKPVDGSGFVVGRGGALADVFVYIKSGLEGKTFEPPKEAIVLDQRGCMFVPRVVGLSAGQTLRVKNSDPVSHNIHPNPRNNYEWNQQQSPGAPDLIRRFARPEVVIPVKCNVHAWMRSYIGVVAHPYFAITDSSGEFEWKTIPPGTYTIGAWHETLGELTENVTIVDNDEAVLKFTFQH
jgi:hypothetical protein